MGIGEKIEGLKQKSDSEKRVIAFWGSLLITILIIFIGVGNSKLVRSLDNPETEDVAVLEERGFFSSNFEKVAVGFRRISKNIAR